MISDSNYIKDAVVTRQIVVICFIFVYFFATFDNVIYTILVGGSIEADYIRISDLEFFEVCSQSNVIIVLIVLVLFCYAASQHQKNN